MKKATLKKAAIYTSASAAALLLSGGSALAQTTINLEAPSAAGNVNNIDASTLIRFIINGLIIVGIIAALLFLLWGGIRWILSGGDKGKVDAARGTIVAAIVGMIIVVLAWVIINTVLQIVTGCGLGDFTLPSLATPPGPEGNRCGS